MKITFLHGLESGPHGSKYRALKERFITVTAPDCTGKNDVEDRIKTCRAHLGTEPVLLVGSSFGGLVAVRLAESLPELVAGMVLCAPALHIQPVSYSGTPTIIIHGTGDDVVPIEVSRAFSLAHGVRLVEVDDGHRLKGSLEEILAATEMLQSSISQA